MIKIKTTTLIVILLFVFSANAARVKCADFNSQAQAQKYYKAKKRGYRSLDRDKDGEACECLPGGSAYDKSICKRFRKKYGY